MKDNALTLILQGVQFKAKTPYHKQFVEMARTAKGRWDKESSTWIFPIRYLDYIKGAIVKCYSAEPTIVTEKEPSPEAETVVEVSEEKDEVVVVTKDTEWKALNTEALLELYLTIEQELRRRGV